MWDLVEKSDHSVETLEKVDYSAGTLDSSEHYFVETFDLVAVNILDLFVHYLTEKLDLVELDSPEKFDFATNYFAGFAERHCFGSH